MRNGLFLVFGVALAILPSLAQVHSGTPQTARQALIEMFTGDDTEALAKHLPEEARKLLPQNTGEPFGSILSAMSSFGTRQFLRGGAAETFDEGPILLRCRQSAEDKTEIAVEHDSLVGEDEEIEVSIHLYHEEQEQSLSVMPRLIFTLRKEKHIWRLTEATAVARVPLTDRDYLQGLRQRQEGVNESAAQIRVTSIIAAEDGYAEQHPDYGFVCSLPILFAPEPNKITQDDSDQPQVYYDPGQGNVEWNGYRFELTGCNGLPATKYQITATPLDADSPRKTFCSDESGTMRFVTGAKVSDCFTGEEVLSSAEVAATDGQQ